ncbi:(d)CMP kinase [Staphylospora marina]|uniref:(d)CMP kinase n=1 Tax=Staphylospora marina TaxID=2490858 RepID=UPI000F5BEA85|nr:(d)CMP kinase [Staphylospora marina]
MRRFAVAIDGPAGAGKSTVARKVADRLGITYVDTGAMYRALAWKALSENMDTDNEEDITHLAEGIRFSLDPNGIRVNGIPLSDEIRTPEVSNEASKIAKMPGVRRILVNKQQEIAATQHVVMDGRDIGTHVLPDADVKIFLTASIDERARRRFEELTAKGLSPDFDRIREEIRRRDENDRTRVHSPLRQAEDAIRIDTTGRSVDEVVETILRLCRNKMGGEE